MHRRTTRSSRRSHLDHPSKCAALLDQDGRATTTALTPQWSSNTPRRQSELSLFLEHTQRQRHSLYSSSKDKDDATCNSDGLSTSAQPGIIDLLQDPTEEPQSRQERFPFGRRIRHESNDSHDDNNFHKPQDLVPVCTHSTDTTESCTSSNTPIYCYEDVTSRMPAFYQHQQLSQNEYGEGVDAEDIYHHFMTLPPPPPPPPPSAPGRGRRPRQEPPPSSQEAYVSEEEGDYQYNYLDNGVHAQHDNDEPQASIQEGIDDWDDEQYPSHDYASSEDDEEDSDYGSPISSYVPNSYNGYGVDQDNEDEEDPCRYQPGPSSNVSSECGRIRQGNYPFIDDYEDHDCEVHGPPNAFTSVNDLPFLREENFEELAPPSIIHDSFGIHDSEHNDNTIRSSQHISPNDELESQVGPLDENEEEDGFTSGDLSREELTTQSIDESCASRCTGRTGASGGEFDAQTADWNGASGCDADACDVALDDNNGSASSQCDAPTISTTSVEDEDECGSQDAVQELFRAGLDETEEEEDVGDGDTLSPEPAGDSDGQSYHDSPNCDEPVQEGCDVESAVCHEQQDENDSVPQGVCQEQISEEEHDLPSADSIADAVSCDWWDRLEEQVQATMPSSLVVSSAMDGEHSMTMETLRQHLQDRVANEDPTQQAIAVAFYQGISMQQKWHEKKMRELQEQHERQLAMLSTNSSRDSSQTTSGPSTSSPSRTEALRQRWRRKTGGTGLGAAGSRSVDLLRGAVVDDNHDHDHDDTRTVATALTTMSCRELSMARYRARILQTMKRHEPSTDENGPCTQDRPSLKAQGNDELGDSSGSQSEEIERLLDELQQAERRQKKLEQQLKQAGVVLAEDIPYQEAKDQVARISKRMNEIGNSEAQHEDPLIQKQLREEYYRLEKDMEKYMTALMLTDEFMEEQKAAEDAWEAAHLEDNHEALQQIRRHMPVDIRKMTRQQLEEEAGVSSAMAKKFQRTNVLQLLRRDPQAIARWHPSNLESLRLSGLTLTERRALHHHLLPAAKIWMDKQGSDPLNQRKLTWVQTMRSNFKEALARYLRHVEESDGVTKAFHRCHLIGKQCPVRANHAMDYRGDLGFPVEDIYEESCVVTAADASSPERTNDSVEVSSSEQTCSSEKKDSEQHVAISEERLSGLREHYKEHPNKVLQVSMALGVCDSMDSLMDRMDGQLENWILQQLEQSQQEPQTDKLVDDALVFLGDFRREVSSWLARDSGSLSSVEIGLSEEVYETAREYVSGVKENLLQENHHEGHRLKLSLKQFEKELENLHLRDIRLSSQCALLPKTRKRKSRTEIMTELWKRDSEFTASSNDTDAGKCPFNSQPLQRPQRPEADSAACHKPNASTAPRPSKGVAPNALLAAISSRRAD